MTSFFNGNSIYKDPDAVLDYSFDWSQWLESGEIIESHAVTVPAGITKDSDTESSGKVTVWLSGGAVGKTYPVICRITTDSGRTDERSINIILKNR